MVNSPKSAGTSHRDAESKQSESEAQHLGTETEAGAPGRSGSKTSAAGASSENESTVHIPEELQCLLNAVQATIEAAGKMMTEISIKIAQENARERKSAHGGYPTTPEDQRYPIQNDRLLEAARGINQAIEKWQTMSASGQGLSWNNPAMPLSYPAVQPVPAFNLAAREWAMFAVNAARLAQAFANHATMAAGGVSLAQAPVAPFLQMPI